MKEALASDSQPEEMGEDLQSGVASNIVSFHPRIKSPIETTRKPQFDIDRYLEQLRVEAEEWGGDSCDCGGCHDTFC